MDTPILTHDEISGSIPIDFRSQDLFTTKRIICETRGHTMYTWIPIKATVESDLRG